MDLKSTISELCAGQGVSGSEFLISETAENMLKKYCKTSTDYFGNVVGEFGEFLKDKPTLLLDAHIDEIGMIVTYITNEGFLKVSNCGGIDTRVLLAQEVSVYGSKVIKGIVTSTPPHLEKDNTIAPTFESIFIDIGMSKEQAEEIVSLGDRVIIENGLISLQNNLVSSKALDDRCGAAAILYALELLKNVETKYNILVLFSSQEEVGERGAKIAAFDIYPDMAIIVDVSFAKINGESEIKCGRLSGGPMIGVAPSLSRDLSSQLIDTAKNCNIPYQTEVMDGLTGTNSDVIGVTKGGILTATLSIPLRYMHTPIETIDISDVESVSMLIAEFCKT